MEKYLQLKRGQTLREVEDILKTTLTLIEYKAGSVNFLQIHFEEDGVWLFFKIDTKILYTIRYESPFPLEIDSVKIGLSKKEVKMIKGNRDRGWPVPMPDIDIWFYDKEGLRLDFEKGVNGKLLIIFK